MFERRTRASHKFYTKPEPDTCLIQEPEPDTCLKEKQEPHTSFIQKPEPDANLIYGEQNLIRT